MKIKNINNSYKKVMFSVIFLFVAVFMFSLNTNKVFAEGNEVTISSVLVDRVSVEDFVLVDGVTLKFEMMGLSQLENYLDRYIYEIYDDNTGEFITTDSAIESKFRNSFSYSFDDIEWFDFIAENANHYAIIAPVLPSDSMDDYFDSEDLSSGESLFSAESIMPKNIYIRTLGQESQEPQTPQLKTPTSEWVDFNQNEISNGFGLKKVGTNIEIVSLKNEDLNYGQLGHVVDIRGSLIYSIDNMQTWNVLFEPDETHRFSIYNGTIYHENQSSGEADFSHHEGTVYFKTPGNEDGTRPAISGEENFATNVDDAKPLSYFQAFLSAYDETDGDLTSSIYVKTDNYTVNRSVLGTHKVIWGVKDLSGNEATLEAYIRVVDVTIPVISRNLGLARIGYKETFNIEGFRKTLNVNDNYDNMTNADITLKTDGYTANKTKLGSYQLVFSAKDSSNNEATFEKTVEVYDNVKPIFSGTVNFATSNTTILTESDIRAQITAHDEIDGNLTGKIKLVEDNYTGNGNKVGAYTIKYSVTDNAGNTEYHTVTINRNDKLPPVIRIEDGVSIKTNPSTPLTHLQIIEILQATGQVSNASTTNFLFVYDEYSGNEELPGIYALSISAKSTDGNESLHNMSVTVLDVEDDTGINVNGKDWVKENQTMLIIGALALGVLGFAVFRKRK